jgi:hypothetical protein
MVASSSTAERGGLELYCKIFGSSRVGVVGLEFQDASEIEHAAIAYSRNRMMYEECGEGAMVDEYASGCG